MAGDGNGKERLQEELRLIRGNEAPRADEASAVPLADVG
jgi:hypothetical protein